MRVLHVISGIDSKSGGPTTSFAGLVTSQADAGLQVTALAPSLAGADNFLAGKMAAAGAVVQLVPANDGLASRFRAGPALTAAVEEAVAEADVVHIHALWSPIQRLTSTVALRRKVPFVVEPCGMLTRWSLRQKRLKKWLYLRTGMLALLRQAAAIHFTSELEERDSLPLGRPTIVEPNGLDLEEFQELPPRGIIRKAYPALQGKPVIAFLGRIFPGKGLEHLVPALAELVRRGSDARLLVIGPDGQGFKSTIDALIQRTGLQERVVFTGLLRGRAKIEALCDADLFCLPSDHENFGIAVIEAIACGLPAIVSPDVGIAGDVVAAGVGDAIPTESIQLANALHRWLSDNNLRTAAAARCRPYALSRFNWAHIASQWVRHYQRIVAVA